MPFAVPRAALDGAVVLAMASAVLVSSSRGAVAKGLDCPSGMVPVRGFCIDAYEAALEVVEVDGKGKTHVVGRHSPFKPVGDATVRAVSGKGRSPQGHISQEQAAAACRLAGKRLCTDEEWITACKGKKPTTWPYGDERVPGRCNDEGTSGMNLLYGQGAEAPQSAYTQENMNDPRLNQTEGSLAVGGRHGKCKSSYGAYDMVGNLHEWTAASGGTFRGGYYLDVTINGDGCDYKTTAHSTKYHDYSTGFRCCWSPGDDARRRAEERKLQAEKKAARDAEKAEAAAKAQKERDEERKAEAAEKAKAEKKRAEAEKKKKAEAEKAEKARAEKKRAEAEKKKKAEAEKKKKAEAEKRKRKAKG